jgi:hypothetical protein
MTLLHARQPLLLRVQVMAGIYGKRVSVPEKLLAAASTLLLVLLFWPQATHTAAQTIALPAKETITILPPITITDTYNRKLAENAVAIASRKAPLKKAPLKFVQKQHLNPIQSVKSAAATPSNTTLIKLATAPEQARTAAQQAATDARRQRALAVLDQQHAAVQQQIALQQQKQAAEEQLQAKFQQLAAEQDLQQALIDQQIARKNKLLAEQAMLTQGQH